MSLNRVVLVGRLTRDPELRYTKEGTPVASFTLAVNRPYTNQQGEREVDFLNCVVWRRPAENTANYCKKGNLVAVDGRLQSRSYEDQTGKRIYVTEVVADSVQFLETKGSEQNNQNSNNSYQENNNQNSQQNRNGDYNNQFNYDPFANGGKPIDISDDDLPF